MLDFEEQKKSEDDQEVEDNQEEEDNILKALLYHRYEEETIDYMGYYSVFLNKTLFLYSLEHNYNLFIQ